MHVNQKHVPCARDDTSLSLVAFSFFSWCVHNVGLESSVQIRHPERPPTDSREAGIEKQYNFKLLALILPGLRLLSCFGANQITWRKTTFPFSMIFNSKREIPARSARCSPTGIFNVLAARTETNLITARAKLELLANARKDHWIPNPVTPTQWPEKRFLFFAETRCKPETVTRE